MKGTRRSESSSSGARNAPPRGCQLGRRVDQARDPGSRSCESAVESERATSRRRGNVEEERERAASDAQAFARRGRGQSPTRTLAERRRAALLAQGEAEGTQQERRKPLEQTPTRSHRLARERKGSAAARAREGGSNRRSPAGSASLSLLLITRFLSHQSLLPAHPSQHTTPPHLQKPQPCPRPSGELRLPLSRLRLSLARARADLVSPPRSPLVQYRPRHHLLVRRRLAERPCRDHRQRASASPRRSKSYRPAPRPSADVFAPLPHRNRTRATAPPPRTSASPTRSASSAMRPRTRSP